MMYAFEIETLTIHKDNLLHTTNWEEYREAHIAYIDFLIQHFKQKQVTIETKMVVEVDHDH